jgi:translation initiation factor 1A
MGKKLIKNESDIRSNILMPNKNDILGVVLKNLGSARMRCKCQDGNTRICRVRGKMKKRKWVREGDIVLVSPWNFEFESKGDIIFRYTRNQADMLRRRGILSLG